MSSKRPVSPDAPVTVTHDDKPAAGLGALTSSLRHTSGEMGLVRGIETLRHLNQETGFDCPGCAWPDPSERSFAEFCENGVKHVAHEATRKRVGSDFFEQWPLSRLRQKSDEWLEKQGRLTQPFLKAGDSDRYRAISWEDAFARIADALQRLDDPNRAVFYTSGRTSNEAAFLYQLLARKLGTNNLPDCSNMCHESSGTGLSEVIGVGKGTVSLEDFDKADAIFILGQNPGSNHPRMLTTLEQAARRGCRIVSINPLRERGLVRFAHPKDPLALLGQGTAIADLFLQVRVGGDIALLKGMMKEVLGAEERAPGRVLDWDFIREKTSGFAELRDGLAELGWEEILSDSGLSREQIREAADVFIEADRVIACWAMGLTQHAHGVANVQELTNLLLLRGQVGIPGAGLCPVRGHSNVQGDRTMGIWEKPSAGFLDKLAAEFDFDPPRAHGFDTVATIEAMERGEVDVFFALGGNFAVATPDSALTARALGRCDLTIQVSTKLNRSHLETGREALILPCLGRSELDAQSSGPQFVTVEDSMSVVHRSAGRLPPASSELLSEVAIVTRLARAVLGPEHPVPWEELCADYGRIRERIERVVPGFERFNQRVTEPGGFLLPSGARTRDFATPDGRAHFRVHELPPDELADDELVMMTIRSHDQFNTTVYSQDDKYRGISGSRRVVFLNAADMRERDLQPGQRVDLSSGDGARRRELRGLQVVQYDLPRRCAAAYFPEANPLIPLDHFAAGSRTPAYKSVAIRVRPASA